MEAEPKSNKRPRESDAMDTDKPSKVQDKKSKKQKAADGAAVPAAESAPSTPATAEKKETKKEKKEKKKAAALSDNPPKAVGDLQTLPSGLQIKDVKVGTGPQAKAGQTISMRYIGKLQNGKVFDSNTKGDPFKFKLGKGEVIKGTCAHVFFASRACTGE